MKKMFILAFIAIFAMTANAQTDVEREDLGDGVTVVTTNYGKSKVVEITTILDSTVTVSTERTKKGKHQSSSYVVINKRTGEVTYSNGDDVKKKKVGNRDYVWTANGWVYWDGRRFVPAVNFGISSYPRQGGYYQTGGSGYYPTSPDAGRVQGSRITW